MINVILEPAANGVIKRVVNQNAGGGRETTATINVYEINNKESFTNTIQFLFEICEDLAVQTGNKFGKENLTMRSEWGSHYEPTQKEIDKKIGELEAELELLRQWKK
jgi:hypothetical protein